MATQQKQLTLSPTKVDTFYNCQRLFYYTYVNPPCPTPEKKHFLVGNIAHRALEDFYSLRAEPSHSRRMSVSFKNAVSAYSGLDKIKAGVIAKDDLYDVKEMLTDYIKFYRDTINQTEIVSLEKLERLTIGPVTVWLKADRIDRARDGAYLVVDYKTSERPPTLKENLASVQLQSYGLLIRQNFSSTSPVRGVYLYLRHINSKHGRHEINITDDMMEEAKKKYIEVHKKINNGCAYIPNYGYKYCRNCDYKYYCLRNQGLPTKGV